MQLTGGAISAMYVGAAFMQRAMPRPKTMRPVAIIAKVEGVAEGAATETDEPSRYSPAPASSSRRRPSGSPSQMAATDPPVAPMSEAEVRREVS